MHRNILNNHQKDQIILGLEYGVDVSKYANPIYSANQMANILYNLRGIKKK